MKEKHSFIFDYDLNYRSKLDQRRISEKITQQNQEVCSLIGST